MFVSTIVIYSGYVEPLVSLPLVHVHQALYIILKKNILHCSFVWNSNLNQIQYPFLWHFKTSFKLTFVYL